MLIADKRASNTCPILKTMILVVLMGADFCWAVEYSLEPEIRVSANHDNNINLTQTNIISLQGRSIEPSTKAKISAETWDVGLDARLTFDRFNRSEFDSDGQTVAVNTQKRNERHNFSLKANIIRDTTRTSESETSGRVSNERREVFDISPGWTYLVSDRNYLSVTTSISAAEYKGERYTDYKYNSVGINWVSAIKENIKAIIQLTGSQNKPDSRGAIYAGFPPFTPSFFELQTKSESKAHGLQLGGEYSFAENWALNGLVGSTYTDQKYSVTDPGGACDNQILDLFGRTPAVCSLEDFSSKNFTSDISVKWKNELSDISVSYSIQNQPSSQGYEVEYERYSIFWRYNTSKKSQLNLKLNYGVNQAIDTSISSIDPENTNRKFGNITTSYSYWVSQNWQLNTRYQYRWQEKEIDDGDADSHVINIGIIYKPTKSIWSR